MTLVGVEEIVCVAPLFIKDIYIKQIGFDKEFTEF